MAPDGSQRQKNKPNGRRGADASLIAALASGLTRQEAAAAAGVSERTVYRRLDDPAFVQRVKQAQDEMIEQSMGTLASMATAAANVLGELLLPDKPDSIRLGAARSIITTLLQTREAVELAADLQEIRVLVEAMNPSEGARRGLSRIA